MVDPQLGSTRASDASRGSAFSLQPFGLSLYLPPLSMASPKTVKGRSFYSTRSGRYKHSRPVTSLVLDSLPSFILLVTLPIYAINSLEARTCVYRCSCAFLLISAYGPESSRHPPPLNRTCSGMCRITNLVRGSGPSVTRPPLRSWRYRLPGSVLLRSVS